MINIKGLDMPEENGYTLEILPDGSVYKQDTDWGTFFPTKAVASSGDEPLSDYPVGKTKRLSQALKRLERVADDMTELATGEREKYMLIPGWRPASRKPPDYETRYLILCESGYICSCRWEPILPEFKSDFHWNYMDVPQYDKVAYWMPLLPYPADFKEER